MRRLAQEMGVGVMTLYGYAGSKEAILTDVVNLALQHVDQVRDRGDSWDSRIAGDVRILYQLCRGHPNLAGIVLSTGSKNAGLSGIRHRIRRDLRDGGFDGAGALRAATVLSYYALGFASGQAAEESDRQPSGNDAQIPAVTSAAPDELPTSAAKVGARRKSSSDDSAFTYGLELILGGLREDLARSSNAV